MSTKEIETLKKTIKEAIRISSRKLREQKKLLGQDLIVSENGEVKVVKP
ncbi:MAG: hypothetical protein R2809_03380 [Flavobacteriales bacterium]